MMHFLSDLSGYAINATDGIVGKVIDFYFDDRRWVIRYIVVNIESASGAHQVLLSPADITYLNHQEKTISVDLTLERVSNNFRIDTTFSVLRYEIDYLSYYGYAFYWGNDVATSEEDNENLVNQQNDATSAHDIFIAIDSVRRMNGDRHLRSYRKSLNYHIQAEDGEIGRLSNFLIDDDTWAIQCCVAKAGDWWPEHQVLITPEVIRDINWGSTNIYTDVTLQQVKKDPSFDASLPQNSFDGLNIHRYQNTGVGQVEIKS